MMLFSLLFGLFLGPHAHHFSSADIFFSIDFAPLITAILTGILCSLIGSLLALRKNIVIVDAASHAVFPGIVIGYLFLYEYGIYWIFICAIAVIFIVYYSAIYFGRIFGMQASIGLMYSFAFSSGVVMLYIFNLDNTHLDMHFVYGDLSTIIWPGMHKWYDIFDLDVLIAIPRRLLLLLSSLLFISILYFCGRRIILMHTFDPAFCITTSSIARYVDVIFVLCVAIGAITALHTIGIVGSIALFICPALTSRALKLNDFSVYIAVSIGFATLFVVLGYSISVLLTSYFISIPINAVGCISLISGMFVWIVVVVQRYRN